MVTVSAAAVLPPVPSSPAPPPAKKFFKKSRIVEKETKEVADEGEGEEGLSSLRQRPRRPAQRTERMSPKTPVPRSPLQARSPLQVLLVFCSDQKEEFFNYRFTGEVSTTKDEQPPPVSTLTPVSS